MTKAKKETFQLSKSGMKGAINMNITEIKIKGIIREYYEQLYAKLG